jgi:hypothetical protein
MSWRKVLAWVIIALVLLSVIFVAHDYGFLIILIVSALISAVLAWAIVEVVG